MTDRLTKLGTMQGRLLPPEPGRFQAFPRERWESEFALAAAVPLDFIEWIFDAYGMEANPILNEPEKLASLTGVSTPSLCADYFMDMPFLRCSPMERQEREHLLARLIPAASRAGVRRVVLPFVDASRIETEADVGVVVAVLREALPIAREVDMELHLETSLDPGNFRRLLDRLPDPRVKVNYDSGNSASLGYSCAKEFAAYGDRVGSVHIKDRVRGGGTVPLGSGDADFPALFHALRTYEYQGDFTLQVARAEPGYEIEWARHNRAFVARHWPLA